MSKLVKDLIINELGARYRDLDSALWVELVGVDGITTNQFRRDLRARNVRLEIVKTLLFRRAVGDGPMSRLAARLEGPVALITGCESAVDAAKVIEAWLPKIKGLRVRGALLEGQFLDQAAAANLSRMPTKRDLQARVAGVIRSPAANLAAAILAGGGRIAGCLKSLTERLEKGGEAAEAA